MDAKSARMSLTLLIRTLALAAAGCTVIVLCTKWVSVFRPPGAGRFRVLGEARAGFGGAEGAWLSAKAAVEVVGDEVAMFGPLPEETTECMCAENVDYTDCKCNGHCSDAERDERCAALIGRGACVYTCGTCECVGWAPSISAREEMCNDTKGCGWRDSYCEVVAVRRRNSTLAEVEERLASAPVQELLRVRAILTGGKDTVAFREGLLQILGVEARLSA